MCSSPSISSSLPLHCVCLSFFSPSPPLLLHLLLLPSPPPFHSLPSSFPSCPLPSLSLFLPTPSPLLFRRGDHTTATCNLFVVPPHAEAVVFSVDGALASNFSLSAKDLKLKHGAVEVARYVCHGLMGVVIASKIGVKQSWL